LISFVVGSAFGLGLAQFPMNWSFGHWLQLKFSKINLVLSEFKKADDDAAAQKILMQAGLETIKLSLTIFLICLAVLIPFAGVVYYFGMGNLQILLASIGVVMSYWFWRRMKFRA
jgi:protein-S-isoprenylcysteine O-methyltransferase Ste14